MELEEVCRGTTILIGMSGSRWRRACEWESDECPKWGSVNWFL